MGEYATAFGAAGWYLLIEGIQQWLPSLGKFMNEVARKMKIWWNVSYEIS